MEAAQRIGPSQGICRHPAVSKREQVMSWVVWLDHETTWLLCDEKTMLFTISSGVVRKLYLMWWWQKEDNITSMLTCSPKFMGDGAALAGFELGPGHDEVIFFILTIVATTIFTSIIITMGHHSDGSATLGSGKIRGRRGRWWRGEEGKKDKKKINR